MSKIEQLLKNRKTFIPFITCGCPNLDITEQLVYALEESGADLIELGIPFSDPTAEGPIIQQASQQALEGGVTTDHIFSMVERIRKKTNVPLVIMTYANVVFSYGIERFVEQGKRSGIEGLILPDVPFEEREEFKRPCQQVGIDFISLVAPTSRDRIKVIVEEAQGFLYCVSSQGVTGIRRELSQDGIQLIKEVKKIKEIPCAIGFGISTPEQVEEVGDTADGVIVGSAFVKLILEYKEDCIEPIKILAKEMKDRLKKIEETSIKR